MLAKLSTSIFGKKAPLSKLKLTDYSEVRTVRDDIWNKVPNSDIELSYFDQYHINPIATVSYRLQSGQIGHLFVHDGKFKGRGLGTQMLRNAIDEIKNRNPINPHVKEIWAVTSNDKFFSRVFNGAFKPRNPAHPTVTGSGYYMEIDKKIE